jgi:hypothetical protein
MTRNKSYNAVYGRPNIIQYLSYFIIGTAMLKYDIDTAVRLRHNGNIKVRAPEDYMGEEKMKLIQAVNDTLYRLIKEHDGLFEKLEIIPFEDFGKGIIFNAKFSLNVKSQT